MLPCPRSRFLVDVFFIAMTTFLQHCNRKNTKELLSSD